MGSYYLLVRAYIVITDRRKKVGFDIICNTNTTVVGIHKMYIDT